MTTPEIPEDPDFLGQITMQQSLAHSKPSFRGVP
jgi:hypothetical protein